MAAGVLPAGYEVLHRLIRESLTAPGGSAVQVARGHRRRRDAGRGRLHRVLVEPEGAGSASTSCLFLRSSAGRLSPRHAGDAACDRRAPARASRAESQGSGNPCASSGSCRTASRSGARSSACRARVEADHRRVPDRASCGSLARGGGSATVGAAGRFSVAGAEVSVTHGVGRARGVRGRARLRCRECTHRSRPRRVSDPRGAIRRKQQAEEAAGEAHSRRSVKPRFRLRRRRSFATRARHTRSSWPESPRLRLSGNATSKSLHARLRVTKGWYLVTGGFRIDDVMGSRSASSRAPTLAGGRFVRFRAATTWRSKSGFRRVMAALTTATATRSAMARTCACDPGALGALRELVTPRERPRGRSGGA